MKITKKWLLKQRACTEGREWWQERKISDGVETLRALISDGKLSWANWLVVRLMSRDQQIQYAIFAASQVLGIYEAKYPGDRRPREAIESAQKYLDTHSKDAAAHAAADAAYAAAYTAYTAYAAADAAYAAAYTAYTAYAAAHVAAYTAYAAAHVAAYTAYTAYAAADAAAHAAAHAADMKIRILEEGIRILGEQHVNI